MKRWKLIGILFTMFFLGAVSLAGAAQLSPLKNGEPVAIDALRVGEWVHYELDVPAGARNLNVQISGGGGDADLYTRFGSKPDARTYDCRPYLSGNSENCPVASPSKGIYYIGVYGYREADSITLVAAYEGGDDPGDVTALTNGVPVTLGSLAKGAWAYYKIDTPGKAKNLTIEISGGSGDVDLYTKYGQEPDLQTYDCRPFKGGNVESCSVAAPVEGTYYIGLYGYDASASVTVKASYVGDDDPPPTEPGYCYTDTVNLTASLSSVKAGFNGSNWKDTILKMYELRWPSGKKLAQAQINDQYFSQFVEKGSFEALCGSMMVAIHEETHMYDLDPSRSSWNNDLTGFVRYNWQPRVNVYEGFPRSEIKYLIENDANDSLDSLYLEGQQGTYKFYGVLCELNAGLMGLGAAATVGEYSKGPVNTMDAAAGYMLHLQLYLRCAKQKYPAFYNKIKNDQPLKDFITIQWLRLHFFLDIAENYSGLSYNVDAILENCYSSANMAILREFTGHQLQQSNCLPDTDSFTPPFSY